MRGKDYERLTSAMARGLIDLADTAIPGLTDAVRSVEVATPLTIEHFTSHEGGCFYGLPLTPERFAKLRPDAVVMHPGPMNRGLEICTEAADATNSWVLRQVSNGVALRMAVLYLLLTDGSSAKLYAGDES